MANSRGLSSFDKRDRTIDLETVEMTNKNFYVAGSTFLITGLGCFAATKLMKNTEIAYYLGSRIPDENYDKTEDSYIYEINKGLIISPSVSRDNSGKNRFTERPFCIPAFMNDIKGTDLTINARFDREKYFKVLEEDKEGRNDEKEEVEEEEDDDDSIRPPPKKRLKRTTDTPPKVAIYAIAIVADKDIEIGQEILVEYGDAYWSNRTSSPSSQSQVDEDGPYVNGEKESTRLPFKYPEFSQLNTNSVADAIQRMDDNDKDFASNVRKTLKGAIELSLDHSETIGKIWNFNFHDARERLDNILLILIKIKNMSLLQTSDLFIATKGKLVELINAFSIFNQEKDLDELKTGTLLLNIKGFLFPDGKAVNNDVAIKGKKSVKDIYSWISHANNNGLFKSYVSRRENAIHLDSILHPVTNGVVKNVGDFDFADGIELRKMCMIIENFLTSFHQYVEKNALTQISSVLGSPQPTRKSSRTNMKI